MPTLIIRDVPEDIIGLLDARAQAAGQSREAWLRTQIAALAREVQVHTNYMIHFVQRGGFAGAVVQYNGNADRSYFIAGSRNVPQEAAQAYEEAKELVGRNALGDREAAMVILSKVSDDVYETPYTPHEYTS